MTKDEMIEGLKAGRVLVYDGWAEDDKQHIVELASDGLITADWYESEQYSCWRIRWKQESPSDNGG